MPVDTEENRLSILPSAGVFHTPDRVALEEGLFAREGLEVTVVREWAMPQGVVSPQPPGPAGVDLRLSKDSMIGSFQEFRGHVQYVRVGSYPACRAAHRETGADRLSPSRGRHPGDHLV